MKRLFWIGSLVFALFWVETPASAEDFTATVPVELRNLPPEITTGRITCLISRLDAVRHETGSLSGANIIAESSQEFTITGGNFTREITLRFNAHPGRSPADGRTYFCQLFLQGTIDGSPVVFNSRGATKNFDTAPGSEFRDITTSYIRR